MRDRRFMVLSFWVFDYRVQRYGFFVGENPLRGCIFP